jgi:hypothetical protein
LVKKTDTQKIPDSIFHWPIDSIQPEFGNCVVMDVGQTSKNEFSMFSKSRDIHADAFENVKGH